MIDAESPDICQKVWGYHREHFCVVPVNDHFGFHECDCGVEQDIDQARTVS